MAENTGKNQKVEIQEVKVCPECGLSIEDINIRKKLKDGFQHFFSIGEKENVDSDTLNHLKETYPGLVDHFEGLPHIQDFKK